MKTKLNFFIGLFILIIVFGMSCKKEEAAPSNNIPIGKSGNITIAEIKNILDSLPVVQGSIKTFTDESLLLEAVVISSDQYGNFYKTLYLEDSTGSLVLKIEGSHLFYDYSFGQTVYLKLAGLNVAYDDRTRMLNIGYDVFYNINEYYVGRIPGHVLSEYLTTVGSPKTPYPPVLSSINDFSDNVGRLVKIEDAQFVSADTNSTYADQLNYQSLNLNIENCSGSIQIILRTSSYAYFAGQQVPVGNGDITAILGVYENEYQLYVNSDADILFDGLRCGNK